MTWPHPLASPPHPFHNPPMSLAHDLTSFAATAVPPGLARLPRAPGAARPGPPQPLALRPRRGRPRPGRGRPEEAGAERGPAPHPLERGGLALLPEGARGARRARPRARRAQRPQGQPQARRAGRSGREDAGPLLDRPEHRPRAVRVRRHRRLPGGRVRMIEWSEQHQLIRDMVRRFVEAEVKPHLVELEHGDLPPYDVLRKMMKAFGLDEMARIRFQKQIEREQAAARGTAPKKPREERSAEDIGMRLIPIIELCHYCPGMVTALGVSVGLTAAAIMSKGTIAQKERWGLPLLTLETIGAWAITEPGSGSDAFGGMRSTARRDGDGYLLNGSKTFITNGPYADTIVFICKLDEPGVEARDRKIVSFILDKGMPGLTQSKPLRKMGLHGSPTGEIFVGDLRAEKERLIGETEDQPARSG